MKPELFLYAAVAEKLLCKHPNATRSLVIKYARIAMNYYIENPSINRGCAFNHWYKIVSIRMRSDPEFFS